MKERIKLVENTIDNNDIDNLISWLKTYPHLTKGEKTLEYEKQWSEWLGCKHSVFVNSGSSANLIMIYALKLSGKLKSNQILVPAVSWATTVSPLIQFGLEPIFVDCDSDTLGIDIEHLNSLLNNKHINPSALLLVHVLGFPCKMNEIKTLCLKHGITLLEDSCECCGSTYNGIKTGNFGLMSTFSYYMGHITSTVEGGMVCTNDVKLNDILLSIRSHGWSRNWKEEQQEKFKNKYNISDFKNMYTFYYPGFNVRSTDINAFLGIEQMKKIDYFCDRRYENFLLYDRLIKNDYWKIKQNINQGKISNFAYPIIHHKRDELSKVLFDNDIENRPLVAGNMYKQPFIQDLNIKETKLSFADIVDKYGLYLPNNPDLTKEKIEYICDIVNNVIS